MFRRRSALPDPFVRVAEHVEAAKEALVGAMPTARRPGTPLAEAIHRFEEEVAAARSALAAWDDPGHEMERLRLEAPALDFEGMAIVLGDLIAPLDVFQEAEHRLR
ncbi:MAG TPA: hypothetical protein VM638_01535 [Actinomycetota bacterium]|nr:hypothetical protein [Actinomycetota bacterium]